MMPPVWSLKPLSFIARTAPIAADEGVAFFGLHSVATLVREDCSVSAPLSELWAAVRQVLEAARGQLTSPGDKDLGVYHEFLSHNELGLALDALVDVAVLQRSAGEVWRSLGSAAEMMGLEPDDSIHGATVEKIQDHLAAAHESRGLQRLLNKWDPIGVRPELGGPDDEYSCLYLPLVERLRMGMPAAEIEVYLRLELEGHFRLSADAKPEVFAGELVDWFASGAPA
jgi:hypothetical protein